MKKVTIDTVAKKVGVSAATVSYALSGKKKISSEVREKIMEAVKELDYRPDITARNLASSKTWTIGLYASSTQNIREDYFFNNILTGVLDVLHEKQYQLMLYADFFNEADGKNPDFSLSQPIDGAIIMNPRINDVYIAHVKERNIPYVVVGTPEEDAGETYFVDFDITAGYYAAVNYLISKGHKKILLMNGLPDYIQSENRKAGYKQAFLDNGLDYDESYIINMRMVEEEGYRAFMKKLEEKTDATAGITVNDTIAVGVLRALRDKKIKVPQKMAVVSAGNTMITRVHKPTITSIDMDAYSLGSKAAEILVDVIEKRRMQPSREIFQTHLEERESS